MKKVFRPQKEPKVLHYRDILAQAGLEEKEAIVYETLLKNGQMAAGELLPKTIFKRGDLYNILYALKSKGFISEKEIRGRKRFEASDPGKIKDYLEEQKRKTENSRRLLDKILPQMMSDYNLFVAKPSVRCYEGKAGLARLYDELNASRPKEILLLRSVFDDQWPEIDRLVNRQIKKQIQLKIKTKALTPLVAETKKTYLNLDRQRLVERRILKKEIFSLPAQVLIWDETVAITSFRGKMITSIIEDANIALTFRIIFAYIWQASAKGHQAIVSRWQAARPEKHSNSGKFGQKLPAKKVLD